MGKALLGVLLGITLVTCTGFASARLGQAIAGKPSKTAAEHMARALCIALPTAVSTNQDRFSDFVCTPNKYDPYAGGWTYRIWTTECAHGRLIHWYLIILADGTVMDEVVVAHTGDRGGLKG